MNLGRRSGKGGMPWLLSWAVSCEGRLRGTAWLPGNPARYDPGRAGSSLGSGARGPAPYVVHPCSPVRLCSCRVACEDPCAAIVALCDGRGGSHRGVDRAGNRAGLCTVMPESGLDGLCPSGTGLARLLRRVSGGRESLGPGVRAVGHWPVK